MWKKWKFQREGRTVGLNAWVNINYTFAWFYGLKIICKTRMDVNNNRKPEGVTWSRNSKVLAVLGKWYKY